MTDFPEFAYLLEEQEIKIANLICENHRLKGLLDDAGINGNDNQLIELVEQGVNKI